MPNTTAITDKKWVVMMWGGVRVYVNEKEKDFFVRQIEAETKVIKFNDEYFRASSVQQIVSAEKIETADRIKRGEWQCKEGHWNDRSAKVCSGCYF